MFRIVTFKTWNFGSCEFHAWIKYFICLWNENNFTAKWKFYLWKCSIPIHFSLISNIKISVKRINDQLWYSFEDVGLYCSVTSHFLMTTSAQSNAPVKKICLNIWTLCTNKTITGLWHPNLNCCKKSGLGQSPRCYTGVQRSAPLEKFWKYQGSETVFPAFWDHFDLQIYVEHHVSHLLKCCVCLSHYLHTECIVVNCLLKTVPLFLSSRHQSLFGI